MELEDQILEDLKQSRRRNLINNSYYVVFTVLGIVLSAILTILAATDVKATFFGTEPKTLMAIIGAISVALQTMVVVFRFRPKAARYATCGVRLNELQLELRAKEISQTDARVRYIEICKEFCLIECDPESTKEKP